MWYKLKTKVSPLNTKRRYVYWYPYRLFGCSEFECWCVKFLNTRKYAKDGNGSIIQLHSFTEAVILANAMVDDYNFNKKLGKEKNGKI